MLKRMFLALMSLNLVYCSSHQTFEQHITHKNCEEALETLPENKTDYKLVSKAQEVSGTVLSYTATGAAYTVQVLWDVTATVGAVVILCSPAFAAGMLAQGQATWGAPLCIPGDVKKVQAPYLGKNVYEGTETWRCPDVDNLSHSIRRVAQCYEERGGAEDKSKALASLQAVSNSGSFYHCLSTHERESFLKDLALAKAP